MILPVLWEAETEIVGAGGNCLRKGGEQEMTARLSVMVGGLPPVREMKEGGGGRALDFSESHLS